MKLVMQIVVSFPKFQSSTWRVHDFDRATAWLIERDNDQDNGSIQYCDQEYYQCHGYDHDHGYDHGSDHGYDHGSVHESGQAYGSGQYYGSGQDHLYDVDTLLTTIEQLRHDRDYYWARSVELQSQLDVLSTVPRS